MVYASSFAFSSRVKVLHLMIRNVARAEQELLEGQKISIVIDDAVKGRRGRGVKKGAARSELTIL